jgi:23S rRNA pseudouridine1911/1915/1917 synthase
MNDLSSRVLYQDEACVVINKLCGEALEGTPENGAYNIAVPRHFSGGRPGDLAVPLPVHRLDVPVTGCVVFARTRYALGFLSAAFARAGAAAGRGTPPPQTVEKHYWAVVERPSAGTSISGAGELRHWLSFDSRKNKSFACDTPGPGRKEALLKYRFVGEGRNYFFLDIELITGRHHQIRAQLARMGLRIKGDLKYGARRSEKDGGIRLHARSVSFPDPSGNGGTIAVTAQPPLRDNLWTAFAEAAGRVTFLGEGSAEN